MPASKSRRAAHIFDLEGPCLELLAVPDLPFALTCKTFYKATQNKRRPPAGIARRRQMVYRFQRPIMVRD